MDQKCPQWPVLQCILQYLHALKGYMRGSIYLAWPNEGEMLFLPSWAFMEELQEIMSSSSETLLDVCWILSIYSPVN